MAQEVAFAENNIVYTEGPFVMVHISGWRVEVELPGHHCPVLPDASISQFLERHGFSSGKELDKKKAAAKVDFLNSMERCGRITRNCKGIYVV